MLTNLEAPKGVKVRAIPLSSANCRIGGELKCVLESQNIASGGVNLAYICFNVCNASAGVQVGDAIDTVNREK